LDEVGFNVSMRKGYGYSLIGTPASIRVPSIRSRNVSVCAVMCRNGVFSYKINTSAFNSLSFCGYLEDVFMDCMSMGLEGCIFVCDKAKIHKTNHVLDVVRENGHQLVFLPPYNPFLNPIENLFSKLKQLVKSMEVGSESEILMEIQRCWGLIDSEDCDGFFRNMLRFLRRCIKSEENDD
jgi:hypothetical protein